MYLKGEYKDDKVSGKGTLYSSNGKIIYKGDFYDNAYSGIGTLYSQDGSVYTGNFLNGIAEGEGVYTSSDGKTSKGIFKNGKYIDTSINSLEGTYVAKYIKTNEWCQLDIEVFLFVKFNTKVFIMAAGTSTNCLNDLKSWIDHGPFKYENGNIIFRDGKKFKYIGDGKILVESENYYFEKLMSWF